MCSEDQRRWHQSALYMFLQGLAGLVGRWSHITITIQGQPDQARTLAFTSLTPVTCRHLLGLIIFFGAFYVHSLHSYIVGYFTSNDSPW